MDCKELLKGEATMDPEATVQLILDNMAEKNWEEAFTSCTDLGQWLLRQGHSISGVGSHELGAWALVNSILCKREMEREGKAND